MQSYKINFFFRSFKHNSHLKEHNSFHLTVSQQTKPHIQLYFKNALNVCTYKNLVFLFQKKRNN